MYNIRYVLAILVVLTVGATSSIPADSASGMNIVSGDFKDDPVNKVILQLCEMSGTSAVLDEDLVKELVVSASIDRKPIDKALAIILLPFDLEPVLQEDSKGNICFTVESSRGAKKPSNYSHPEFPARLEQPVNARFENSDLPDALRKVLEANAETFADGDYSTENTISYTWCDKRMKGVKVAVLANGIDLGTLFEALLETTGLGYEYEEELFYIAPKGYFDPDVRLELPEIESAEASAPIWLLYHDKCLNDILDDLFQQVNIEYTSPSVDIKNLKSSIRLEGIPFSVTLRAVLLPQRLTFQMVEDTVVIKYPEKW